MIDFGQTAAPEPQRGRRGLLAIAAAIVVVLVAGVALINAHRQTGNRRAAAASRSAGAPTSPGNTGSPAIPGIPDPGGGTASRLPAVSCPQIRDEQSQLGYRCIDNYLVQDGAGILLGLRIALNHEVEPGWVISEGSGNPLSVVQPPDATVIGYRAAGIGARTQPTAIGYHTGGKAAHRQPIGPGAVTAAPLPNAQQVQAEVHRRADLALASGYGDNPESRVLAEHARDFPGITGYELLIQITVNPIYRAAQGLQVKTERLWVVGLPTKAGVSIFMMSIPDERADLWPKAEATVGTVHVL